MKNIPLSKGKAYAMVDDDDYEVVSGYTWYLQEDKRKRKCAVYRQDRKTLLMHRLIMNAPRGKDVDHKNGNALDNTRKNLRVCTRTQNLANTRKRKGTSSRFKGVYWNIEKKRWMAYIRKHKKLINLGYFASEVDAAQTYNREAGSLFGEFAKLNEV